MNDAYVEWLVKRKTPVYAFAVKALMIIVAILLAPVLLFKLAPFGAFLILAEIGVIYFVFPMFSIEFEYLAVNDQLSIDKIVGQKRRKRIWEGTLDKIEVIAPLDSYLLKDAEKKDMKVMDCSSHTPDAKVYGIITQTESGAKKILIEPNEKLLKHLWSRAPRKVVQ